MPEDMLGRERLRKLRELVTILKNSEECQCIDSEAYVLALIVKQEIVNREPYRKLAKLVKAWRTQEHSL